jgi:hypothetical protein
MQPNFEIEDELFVARSVFRFFVEHTPGRLQRIMLSEETTRIRSLAKISPFVFSAKAPMSSSSFCL